MEHVQGMLEEQFTTTFWGKDVQVKGTCVNVCVAEWQSPTHAVKAT
jgi:hypothetical protein